MKSPSWAPRETTTISDHLQRKLEWYAIAASAAGVSVLATVPASARIVYTPAHRVIPPNHNLSLDLNHDGTKDFTFQNRLSTTSVGSFKSDRLSIFPEGGNQIWGQKNGIGQHYASALSRGITVGPSGKFSSGSRSMAYGRDDIGSYYCEGKWNGAVKKFLGLKFTIHGTTHFGWARLNVNCNLYKVQAVLTGYAYETIANKAIVTGRMKGQDSVGIGLARLARGTPKPLGGQQNGVVPGIR